MENVDVRGLHIVRDLSNKKLLTITELSQYTGIGTKNLFALIRARKLPYYNPFGSVMFFDREEIEKTLMYRHFKVERDDRSIPDVTNLEDIV